MVERPNAPIDRRSDGATSWRPVHGVAWSSPRSGGGAPARGPTTLKRNCAQRSWDREVDDVSFIGCRYFHCSPPVRWCGLGSTTASRPLSPGILCGTGSEPHITSSFQAIGVVIGARNLSNSSSRSRRSTPKLRHKDKGIVFGHNGGMNRARASLQNELSTKSHQPPLTPPLQSAPVDPQGFAQARHSLGLQAVHHGRNQHHDQTRINPPPHEAHRRRRVSPPAAFLVAAETVAINLLVSLAIPLGLAARLRRLLARCNLPEQ